MRIQDQIEAFSPIGLGNILSDMKIFPSKDQDGKLIGRQSFDSDMRILNFTIWRRDPYELSNLCC